MNVDKNRAQGCLLGLAVGDVLGCPIEALHPDTIHDWFGCVDDLVAYAPEDVTNPHYWRLPGLHSDDTQQALTVADVLLDCGCIDDAALLDVWRRMAAVNVSVVNPVTGKRKPSKDCFGCHRGTGGSFRALIKYGDAPPPISLGNGAAMRVAPVGLYFAHDPASRVENALRLALVTSRHPHAAASACAMAAAVAGAAISGEWHDGHVEAIRDETRVGERMLESRFADRLDAASLHSLSAVSEAIDKLLQMSHASVPEALASIVTHAEECLGERGLFATKGYALTAVPSAILLASRYSRSFGDGIVSALNLGGDTDTVAAMTGAILGAGHGVTAIPENWRGRVLASEHIVARADALATGVKSAQWHPVLDFETAYTRTEVESRQELRNQIRQVLASEKTAFISVDDDIAAKCRELFEWSSPSHDPLYERIYLVKGRIRVARLAWHTFMDMEEQAVREDGTMIGWGGADIFAVFRVERVYRHDLMPSNLCVCSDGSFSRFYVDHISDGHITCEQEYPDKNGLMPS